MRIEESSIANIPIYKLSGKVMGGDDVLELCATLKERLSSGLKNLVIDLAEVEWTNSCVLGMLVGLHVSATNAGGRLTLANIENVRKLLEMTRLIEILNTYESVDEAIRSCEPVKPD